MRKYVIIFFVYFGDGITTCSYWECCYIRHISRTECRLRRFVYFLFTLCWSFLNFKSLVSWEYRHLCLYTTLLLFIFQSKAKSSEIKTFLCWCQQRRSSKFCVFHGVWYGLFIFFILCIPFGSNMSQEKRWSLIMDTFCKNITKWKVNRLSIRGWFMLLNLYAFSLEIYFMSVLKWYKKSIKLWNRLELSFFKGRHWKETSVKVLNFLPTAHSRSSIMSLY